MADIIPKKLLTTQNILIGAGIAVALYFVYQNMNKPTTSTSPTTHSFQEDQTVKTDPHLELRVTPSVAIPNVPTTINISGVFKNDSGSPSPASVVYYAIYDSQNRMIRQGTLGSNVTSFSKHVVLPPLHNGEFMVSVSDEPIVLAPSIEGGFDEYPYGVRRRHHFHHRGRRGVRGGQMLPQTPTSTATPTTPTTTNPVTPSATPQMTQQQQIMPPTTMTQQPLTPGVI